MVELSPLKTKQNKTKQKPKLKKKQKDKPPTKTNKTKQNKKTHKTPGIYTHVLALKYKVCSPLLWKRINKRNVPSLP